MRGGADLCRSALLCGLQGVESGGARFKRPRIKEEEEEEDEVEEEGVIRCRRQQRTDLRRPHPPRREEHYPEDPDTRGSQLA